MLITESKLNNIVRQIVSTLNENKQFQKLLSGDSNMVRMDDQYAHAELFFEQLEDGEMAIYLSEIWSDVRGRGYATKLLNKIKNICLNIVLFIFFINKIN